MPAPLNGHQIRYLLDLYDTLCGSYTIDGIFEWFDRPRPQLDGQTPAEHLGVGWSPDDDNARRVMDLARATE